MNSRVLTTYHDMNSLKQFDYSKRQSVFLRVYVNVDNDVIWAVGLEFILLSYMNTVRK